MKKLMQMGIMVLGALTLGLGPVFAATRVALVLDKGGREDKSFNEAAVRGGQKAQKELGIELKIVETTDDNGYEPALRAFARKKFDLVIGIGFSQAEALKKVAKDFPEVSFAIVDGDVALPNVRSLMFQEHEGSFLVGAIAALKSKSHKIGFIGGMDIPLIRRFELGYRSGAEAARPGTSVVTRFVGVTGSAWNNPPKGKELAQIEISAGADVIFVAAGATGTGVFDAVEEKKILGIGVDSNQNWIKPGKILTSMLKRVDTAVFEACWQRTTGAFSGGVTRYGLENQGIDYALDEYNRALITPEIQKKVDQIKKDIISKKIKVPDYYERESK